MIRAFDNFQDRVLNANMQPNEPTCCGCFPLSCGIKLIGLMIAIDLFGLVELTLKMMEVSKLVSVFLIFA